MRVSLMPEQTASIGADLQGFRQQVRVPDLLPSMRLQRVEATDHVRSAMACGQHPACPGLHDLVKSNPARVEPGQIKHREGSICIYDEGWKTVQPVAGGQDTVPPYPDLCVEQEAAIGAGFSLGRVAPEVRQHFPSPVNAFRVIENDLGGIVSRSQEAGASVAVRGQDTLAAKACFVGLVEEGKMRLATAEGLRVIQWLRPLLYRPYDHPGSFAGVTAQQPAVWCGAMGGTGQGEDLDPSALFQVTRHERVCCVASCALLGDNGNLVIGNPEALHSGAPIVW